MSDNKNTFDSLTQLLARYARLNLGQARMVTAEKLTVLLSTIAIYALAGAVAMIVLIFASVGVGHLLATTALGETAYLYVAAFYALLLICLLLFRRRLIIDPMARFLTRLLVKPPKNDTDNEDNEE